MQTSMLLIGIGIVLFAIAIGLFRTSEGRAVPIWKSGAGRSRAGLAAWFASIACLGVGLALVFRD